ncbi:MAG: reverse transcriptase/maturase family protein [Evtepia sp.]
MKTIRNIYPQIYDYENLYKAWESARKGKKYRDEVLTFSNNLESNLIDIQNHMIYKTYHVGRYRPFYVYEPKKRLVMALPFRDRVVQWAIYRKLFPLLETQFIFDSYACRKGKGVHAAANRLQYWLCQTERKQEKYYYLKLDISKYFYRVDHAILMNIIGQKIQDEDLKQILSEIINCEDMKFGLPSGASPGEVTDDAWLDDVGMPIGNLTSQLFANLYLNELDQFIKHTLHIHYYIRYMDDMIILGPDKAHLGKIKEEIESFLNHTLKLQLNDKTTIRPCSMGIDFVGFHIRSTHRKLKKQTARKIEARIRFLFQGVKNGEIEKSTLEQSVASYDGILKHFSSYGFCQKLNRIYTKI